MRKWIALFLVLLLAGCAAPAASTPANPPPAPPTAPVSAEAPPAPQRDDLTPVRWLIVYPMRMDSEYMLNNIAKPAEAMADVLNPSLANAGLKLEITMGGYQDAVEYTRMVPTIIASKEEIDLLTLYSDFTPLLSWIGEGYFHDFGAEIDAHQPILEALDPIQIKLARKGQAMYYIPTAINYAMDNSQSHLYMEGDVATSLNLEPPASLDALLTSVRTAHDAALPYQVALNYTTLDEFRREDPAFPCVISDDLLFLYDAQGVVSSYAHSDVFLRDAERMQALRNAAPNALVFPTQKDVESRANDKYIVDPNILVFSPEHPAAMQDRQSEATSFQISPDKPQIFFSSPYGSFVSVIPSYAEANLALRFFDWAYGSTDNYMLMRYGKEGVHYTKNPNGSLAFSKENPSGHLSWMIGQIALNERTDQGDGMTSVSPELKSRNGFELMPWNGFVFDPTPVQNLYERVKGLYFYGETVHSYRNSIMSSSGDAIVNGLHGVTAYMRGEIPMDDFDLKLAELDAAGMPEVLEECQKQYADYLAATGWKPQ